MPDLPYKSQAKEQAINTGPSTRQEPVLTFDAFRQILGAEYCKDYSANDLTRLYEISMAFNAYAYKSWLQSRQKMVK